MPNQRQRFYPDITPQQMIERWGARVGLATPRGYAEPRPPARHPIYRDPPPHDTEEQFKLWMAISPQRVPPREQWERLRREQGALGPSEVARRTRYGENVPFVGGFIEADRDAAMRKVNEKVEAWRTGKVLIDPTEYLFYLDLLRAVQDEADYRQHMGTTRLGRATEISIAMAPYMIEFAATSGVYGAASKGVRGAVQAGLRSRIKSKAGQLALRVGSRLAGGGVGAAARMPLLPGTTWASYQRHMLDGDSSDRAFLRALGGTWIEFATEETGTHIMRYVGRGAAYGIAHLPGKDRALVKFARTLHGAWRATGKTTQAFEQAFTAARFDGILGEMAEEQVARMAHWAAGTEDVDLKPTTDELIAQAVAFGIPAGVRAAPRVAAAFGQRPGAAAPPATPLAAAQQQTANIRAATARLLALDPRAEAEQAERAYADISQQITEEHRLEPKPTVGEVEGPPLAEQRRAAAKALAEARRMPVRESLADVIARKQRAAVWGSTNQLVSQERADAARERLRERRGGAMMGVDPTAFVDLVTVGVFHFEAGLRKFADWSASMVEEFGESVKPRLAAVWQDFKPTR